MPSDTDNPKTATEMGRKGGAARAARMSPEQRSEAARRASHARWRRDLEEAATELAEIPDCAICGCPESNDHALTCQGGR